MDNDFLKTLKDLFKTRKRLKEEEAQAVYDALKNEKDTVERLAELEKEYEESRPKETAPDFDEMFKPVKYDRVSYDLLSDEEIEKKAAEQGNAEYVGKISDVNKKLTINSYPSKTKNAPPPKRKPRRSRKSTHFYRSCRKARKTEPLKTALQGAVFSKTPPPL